jgi:hypothetical protein
MSAPDNRARALKEAKKSLYDGKKTEFVKFNREIPPFEN